jgi:hypothetical protein
MTQGSGRTLVEPHYKRTSAVHTVDGVKFFSYWTGINRYSRVSEDGQCEVTANTNRDTYSAQTLNGGYVLGASGKPKRFRTQDTAARAAIKESKSPPPDWKQDQAETSCLPRSLADGKTVA